jgi:hypothetical protein
MKKIAISLMFFFLTSTSWALLPPQYLSVPDWKDCVGSMNVGSYNEVCLPHYRPKNCSRSSWHQLKRLRELPLCRHHWHTERHLQ